MILDVDPAVSLTAYGKLADATFPQALENPPGFPQTHSLDDEISLLTSFRGTNGHRSNFSKPGSEGVGGSFVLSNPGGVIFGPLTIRADR